MEGIGEFLEAVRRNELVAGRLRGVFHIAIGRRITAADGRVLSAGITWRDLAVLLKQLRFDKDLAREVGVDPDVVAPRDRQRMWYSAIASARVNSPDAISQAEELIPRLESLGFQIGPPPGPGRVESPSPPPPPSTTKSKRKK